MATFRPRSFPRWDALPPRRATDSNCNSYAGILLGKRPLYQCVQGLSGRTMLGGTVHTVKGGGERELAQGRRKEGTEPGAHSVQFYEDPSLFLDQLAECTGSALGSGGACIVIATAEHRSGLAERLKDWAIDISSVTDSGRYIALDAEETMARFMVEGWPNRELFYRAIEPLLPRAQASAARKPGVIFVFGEMVTLLWEDGHHDAAIQLEQLWNEMQTHHEFSLLCAYPLSSFAHESQQELFRQVCQEHSHVGPAEGYSALASEAASESGRLRMIRSLQQRSAAFRSAVEEREQAIAQRDHAEDKLWRSEEFARRIVESCVDCLKVLDLEGRLEYMSPSGQALLEIDDLSTYLGRPWKKLWRAEDRPRVEAALKVARSGGEGRFQAGLATGSDARKQFDVRIAPMRGRDGTIERLIAVSRDITDLRQAQQIAMQAEKLAAAGRMAATIAHEINNPLEAVTNFLYLARTIPDMPEQAQRHLEIADRELTRVAQIAQKTLGFYRDTSNNKWISVSEVIADVLLIYDRKLRYKRMKAVAKIDPVLKVFAKQGELKQALSNLLANAIDASDEGGCVWLRAHASSHWTNGMEPGTRITVADNGAGMAPEVQNRIFVPFFTTKPNVGTGIGLWVTKSLIEQQGGYLHFRSRQGQHSGTVMSFFLSGSPRAQAQELSTAA